jgi:hypothetical protein
MGGFRVGVERSEIAIEGGKAARLARNARPLGHEHPGAGSRPLMPQRSALR